MSGDSRDLVGPLLEASECHAIHSTFSLTASKIRRRIRSMIELCANYQSEDNSTDHRFRRVEQRTLSDNADGLTERDLGISR